MLSVLLSLARLSEPLPRLSIFTRCVIVYDFFFVIQKILTHSYSRVVLRVLEKAAAEKKRFSVYVTESQPDAAG